MYTIDINLLKERPEYGGAGDRQFIDNTGYTTVRRPVNRIPIFIGAGVAALTLLASGGAYLWLGQEATRLEAKQKELDDKLGNLKAQEGQLAGIMGEIGQVNAENQSLASVFSQIQPWSATLQELRESVPQGIQIANISQSDIKIAPKAAAPAAPAAPAKQGGGLAAKISTPPDPTKPAASPAPAAATSPAPAAAASPAPAAAPAAPGAAAAAPADVPTTKIDIDGQAKNFDDVNNFVLTLKQSGLINPDETRLISANLVGNGTPIEKLPAPEGTKLTVDQEKRAERLELPKVVQFKIQTVLKQMSPEESIRELERKGAVGSVTRLKNLPQSNQTGVK
jgi:type IV pilus assembly protein PilN